MYEESGKVTIPKFISEIWEPYRPMHCSHKCKCQVLTPFQTALLLSTLLPAIEMFLVYMFVV